MVGHVDRLLERLLEGDGAAELPVVVLGHPLLSRGDVAHRAVIQHLRRRAAGLERGQEDERLEGRSWLAMGVERAVELGPREVGAPDQGLDVAGRGLDHDHRSLRGSGGGTALAPIGGARPPAA